MGAVVNNKDATDDSIVTFSIQDSNNNTLKTFEVINILNDTNYLLKTPLIRIVGNDQTRFHINFNPAITEHTTFWLYSFNTKRIQA